jgi:glycolate oxidase
LIATFPTIKQAASASIGLLTFSPSMLEIVDQTTIKAVEHWHALGFETVGSILLMQSDDKSTDLDKAQALCESHGAIDCFYSDNPADADDLIRVRKLAYPAFERMGVALLDDIAVPMTEIANIVEEVESIAKKFDVTIGIFGHAGDGNLHPTIVHPHGDDAAAKRALDAFHAIVSAAQARGGTATGEHGVGALKVDLVKNELSHEVRELQRGIKNLFDPKGILNPGKKLA